MKVFHGSNIAGLKELVVNNDANLLHGPGIYLTFSKEEAKGYGSSLYQVKVTGAVFDTTDPSVLELFVTTLFSSHGVTLKHLKNPAIQDLIKWTVAGKSSGVFFHDGLFVALTEDPVLYQEVILKHFGDLDTLLSEINTQFNYKLIKVKSDLGDWLISLTGAGLEIESEIPARP